MTPVLNKICVLVVSALLLWSIPGCHIFNKWVPVRDGIEFEGDSVVRLDGVEVKVRDFGIEDSWGSPEFKISIKNGSNSLVVFDSAECFVDIAGTMVPPYPFPYIRVYRLQPGEHAEFRIKFDGHLELVPRDDTSNRYNRVVPETLDLHLAPILIGDHEHSFPVFSYMNPDP